jgi:acyl-CoA synthetase (NDP forming)
MTTATRPRLDRDLLEKFFNPRSVAIIGASTNTAKMAGRAWVNLDKTGYGGQHHLVNPNRDEIGPHRAYRDLDDIDGDIDAAIVLVNSSLVPDAVARCAERGIPAVTVCTAGFEEIGDDGRRLQERFVASAGSSRLIGPNCIGILNVADNYVSVPTYNVTYKYTPGGVTMLSHSGGMAVNLFNRAQGRGIGIRALVTLGNEADIDMAEMVEALVDDEKTTVITLFMERLGDGERFVRAARMAHEAGKPIVALKVGRSEVGRRSVESHTGALAGDPEVYSGVLRQAGVLQVDGLDELLDASHLLATSPPPAGRRVGVFTVSGGESSYFADRASPKGVELPMPTEATMARLHELVRFAVPGNPFDATGQIIGDPEYVRAVVDTFCADPNFDALALTTATWGSHDADQLLPAIIAAAEANSKPTVICSWSATNHTERAWELLGEASVPVYETSDRGVDALAGLIRWHHGNDHVGEPDRSPTPPIPGPAATGIWGEHSSKQLLAEHGIAVGETHRVATSAEAATVAAAMGGELAVKFDADGLVHKTELGLVRIGVPADDVASVVEELGDIASRYELLGACTVGRMYRGVELIVGGTIDPRFGPLVMVGAGGVLAEITPDVRFLSCPATSEEIDEALRGLRCWPVLAGARGARPDVAALVGLVSAVARFVDGARDWLEELDLNPVIVAETGAVAVDATIVVKEASS